MNRVEVMLAAVIVMASVLLGALLEHGRAAPSVAEAVDARLQQLKCEEAIETLEGAMRRMKATRAQPEDTL